MLFRRGSQPRCANMAADLAVRWLRGIHRPTFGVPADRPFFSKVHLLQVMSGLRSRRSARPPQRGRMRAFRDQFPGVHFAWSIPDLLSFGAQLFRCPDGCWAVHTTTTGSISPERYDATLQKVWARFTDRQTTLDLGSALIVCRHGQIARPKDA